MKYFLSFLYLFGSIMTYAQQSNDINSRSKELYDWTQKDIAEYTCTNTNTKLIDAKIIDIAVCENYLSKISFKKEKKWGKALEVNLPNYKRSDGFDLKIHFDEIINEQQKNVATEDNLLALNPINGEFSITINDKRVFYININNPSETDYFYSVKGTAYCIVDNFTENQIINTMHNIKSVMHEGIRYQLAYCNQNGIYLALNKVPKMFQKNILLQKGDNLYNFDSKVCTTDSLTFVNMIKMYYQESSIKIDLSKLDQEFYLMYIPTKELFNEVVFQSFKKKQIKKIEFKESDIKE